MALLSPPITTCMFTEFGLYKKQPYHLFVADYKVTYVYSQMTLTLCTILSLPSISTDTSECLNPIQAACSILTGVVQTVVNL